MERTGLLYDAHIPYHNPLVMGIALKYLKGLDLTRLILGGDFADFYKVSSWSQDPKRKPFHEEIDIVKKELGKIRTMFPDIPIDYLEGNHEARLSFYIKQKAPSFSGLIDVESLLDLKSFDMTYISNIKRLYHHQPPYRLGKLFVTHGHELRVSATSVNLARLYYYKAHCSLIVGHHHVSECYKQKKLDLKYDGCWMIGTLGKLQEPYLPVNNWIHGFAWVEHSPKSGLFNVHNKIIMNGQVKNS